MYIIAVDIGGTNLRVALVDTSGKIIERWETPTRVSEGEKIVIRQMIEIIRDMLEKGKVDVGQIMGIGIGCPGPLDTKTGVIIDTPNLGWKNVALKDTIEQEFHLPVCVDNDGNLAALGESWLGAGREVNHLVCLTLGTGIGGGIIINGEILHGANDAAGELGHIIVEPNGLRCGCGNYGCMEAYASGPGITKRTIFSIKEGITTIITELVQNQLEKITPLVVYQAAIKGDELANDILKETGRYLGIGIVSLVNVLNPQLVIIGGRIAQMGEILLNHIKDEVTKRTHLEPCRRITIVPSQLSDDAGIIGAAKMIQNLIYHRGTET
ncbi:MAG: ROK family protein [bacterium]|nr:ROK family protein [bacterium]